MSTSSTIVKTLGEKELKKSIKEANKERKSVDAIKKKIKGIKKVNLNNTLSNQNLIKKKIKTNRSNSQNTVSSIPTRPSTSTHKSLKTNFIH